MKRRMLILAAVVAAMLTLIVRMPLGWVLPKPTAPGWDSMVYIGTVWNGAVARVPGLGDIKTQTRIRHIFTGKPPVLFSLTSPALTGLGSLSLSQTLQFQGTGSVSGLSHIDGRLGGLSGGYEIAITSLQFREGCTRADGWVRTDLLAKNSARYGWAGPSLEGPLRCDGGDLLIQLTGRDAAQMVAVDLRIIPDGTFRSEAMIETSVAGADRVLPLFGFERNANGYRISESGRWQ